MRERRALELLVGVYAGTVLVPAGALWLRAPGGNPGIGALVGAGVAIAAAVALFARSVDDLADRLASLPVAAASVLPPLAYLPYMVLATRPESPEAFLAVAGLLAVLPGIAVPVGGAIVRNRRLRKAATELAVVTVGGESEGEIEDGDADGRDWPIVAAAVVMGLSLVAFGAVVLLSGDVETGAITPMLGAFSTWLLFLGDDDETEIGVTDRGLRIDRSFTPWEDLAGYRVDDEEVELVRERRYLPARSFDRGEIDDADALLDGLGRFLPRLDEHGRVELSPRRR